MGWKSKCDRAKKLHRPSLKNWECDEFHKTFPSYASTYLSPQSHATTTQHRLPTDNEAFLPFGQATRYHRRRSLHDANLDRDTDTKETVTRTSTATVDLPVRFDARSVSPYEFQQRYEARYLPCVISSIPQGHDVAPPPPPRGHLRFVEEEKGEEKKCDELVTSYYSVEQGDTTMHAWEALKRWSPEALMSNEQLRERTFKCGEDDDGNTIRVKLKHFLRYLKKNRDDSPLYIFHSTFDEDRIAKRLLLDYRVPTYFSEDLFHLVGENRRPPYRWFLVGPQRSGTTVHIDPLATSAWNTLIHGTKRWVIFPPYVPKSLVKGHAYIKKGEDDEAIHYFTTILPRIKRAAAELRRSNPTAANTHFRNFECYEFTQHAGETVYIPGGWWHAVLNLTDTVGVTQNFCSEMNFDDVWLKTRVGRKRMAYKWLMKLDVHYPHLARRAREMNEKDGFVMKYDPKEVAKREEMEKKAKREKESIRRKSDGVKVEKVRVRDGGVDVVFRSTSKEKLSNRDVKRSRVESAMGPMPIQMVANSWVV